MNEMRWFMMLNYYVYRTFKTVAIVKYCLYADILGAFFIISVEL